MLDDPGVDVDAIAACLSGHYDVRAASVNFLPVGHDPYAAVYKVAAGETSYFLKVRFGPVDEGGLLVPRALIDSGIGDVVAPLRTRDGRLWQSLDEISGFTVVLYPYVPGVNAKDGGMSDGQWRAFGAALRAVHASGLERQFRGRLRTESFALPSAALVREMQTLVKNSDGFESAAADRFAASWRGQSDRITWLLARAEELGFELRSTSFEMVLCHSDIHSANLLLGEDGRVWLVDWDSPIIAPPERDLLFVVGSRIARTVEPLQEDLFFEGYGSVQIDPAALIYHRYERIVEDLGEFGKSVFTHPSLSEQAREIEADLGMSFFAPGDDIDRAERVPRTRWSNAAP